ncbi:MAG: sulfite exporter TauE/SafE family protein [Pseudolabrys sp.]|nr:sulfite exporter TauE/SafE family protein [Pseudolabrys sp.]MSP32769.1 sulfite exporter TauE/SafE family protein [Pseudolabrys sp.]
MDPRVKPGGNLTNTPPLPGHRPIVTIIADPLFYMLAVPAVIALGLSKGGFAGAGQMATPMLALVMPPLEAAAIMLPIMIVQDATAVWVYRKDWSGRILAIVIPGAIIGVGLGWLLAAHISDAAVRVFTGAATIAFVLYNWIGPARVAKNVGTASVPSGVFWGAVSGFTSTIAQAGGPPYQMYVLPQNLPKMKFVGTTAIVFASLNWMKVVPYVALGQFSTQGLGTSLALLPLAIAANLLGFWLVRVTPQEIFYKITMLLMFAISIELVRSGMSEILRG